MKNRRMVMILAIKIGMISLWVFISMVTD